MGRRPIAFGVWPAMIRAAGGVAPLARALGCSPRNLRRVFTGFHSLRGPCAELSRAFAEEHGITVALFIHPAQRGAFLLSTAEGWFFFLGDDPGGWQFRRPWQRRPCEDWSGLPVLEVDFASIVAAPVGKLGA